MSDSVGDQPHVIYDELRPDDLKMAGVIQASLGLSRVQFAYALDKGWTEVREAMLRTFDERHHGKVYHPVRRAWVHPSELVSA